MTTTALLIVLLAALAGLSVGWLLRARVAAPMETERQTLAQRIVALEEIRNAALRDLAVAVERADQAELLRRKLEETDDALDQAERSLAAIRADHIARTEGFEAQIKGLTEAREQLSAQFSETAAKLLGEAQRTLVDRADQRFHQAHEKSEASLKALLQPVETTLKRYEEGLGKIEQERVGSYAALREAVEQVRLGSAEARVETAKLVNALRSTPRRAGAGVSSNCAMCWKWRD